MRNLPAADKYEVRCYGLGQPTITTCDPDDALVALHRDGEITAVRNCVGRVVAARVNGHLLNAREYRAHLDLTDGGKVRAMVEASRG